MKNLIVSLLFATLWINPTAQARVVEIDVYGMTCAFCVDSLQRTFEKMSAVSKVDVSLKQKKIRLETEPNQPSLESLKQAVLETGFTPVKITVQGDENAK
ncbi:MAG: heavy metal-associated domain-containing protein [Gammaproteobacteria bacterium]|nr:heavy metal-associated domain-containing protein [Gammaproteobacteria bacterium]